MTEDEYLTVKEVCAYLKMSDTTFREFRKRQTMFPSPVDIGPTKTGKPTWRWLKSEVEAFRKLNAALQRKPVEDSEIDAD